MVLKIGRRFEVIMARLKTVILAYDSGLGKKSQRETLVCVGHGFLLTFEHSLALTSSPSSDSSQTLATSSSFIHSMGDAELCVTSRLFSASACRDGEQLTNSRYDSRSGSLSTGRGSM